MSKTEKIENVAVLTLGCAKNLVDSERFSGLLKANGLNIIDSTQGADALVINTCGFINSAKQENVETILKAAELRKSGKIKNLIVTGCLAERYNESLRQQIEDVDYFLGVNSDERILKILKGDDKYTLVGERMLFTPKHYAYLKISEGCDQKCSFCAIPLMRGKHLSEPIEKLVKEAEGLVANGVKELVLIAQDSTYYGRDMYGKVMLAELLDKLSDIEGLGLMRLMYAYPRAFPLEVLDVIAAKPKIAKYIDIPLQHASDKVLKSMRRGVTREKIETLLDTIRTKVPGISIRSTFIVGYPNETEADFAELMDFIDTNKLDRLGVFTYSQEEGTYANPLGDPIPQDVKERRKEDLMILQQQISLEKNKAKVGSIQRVLIDEKVKSDYIGRTEADAPEVDNNVIIKTKKKLNIGTFIDCKITEGLEYDLVAQVVE